MASMKRELPGIGEWVSGTTPLDEKFIGYIESVDEQGMVSVWVTQSDHDTLTGTRAETKLAKVRRIPERTPSHPEEIRSLIELALMTHDKEWFETLRDGYSATDRTSGERYLPFSGFGSGNPRLRGLAPRKFLDA